MAPAELVRPRALLNAVSRSWARVARTSRWKSVLCRNRGIDVVDVDHNTVALSRASRSTPCVDVAGKSTPRSVGVPPDYVAFGPKAMHVGCKPVFRGGGHRRGPARTPFRTQWSRGLLRTILDVLSRPPRQDVLRPFRGDHASGGGPAGRRGTVGSQRDEGRHSRGDSPWSTRDVDTGQVESGGVAPRCLISAPRRRAARVASLGRTQRWSMSTGSNGFPYQVTTSSCSS